MKILGIIPARYGSTRFPGKPLADINGKPMVQRVYEQALKCKRLNEVIIASDDKRIEAAVKKFKGNCIMTSRKHKSGTDRCNEALKIAGRKYDAVINIQGDEPFIYPEQISKVASCFIPFHLREERRGEVQIATLAIKMNVMEELKNHNAVKVVVNKKKEALYFSRSAIPYCQEKELSIWVKSHSYYKHIGLYGYRTDILREITRLKNSPLELAESLEQLRWLENGYRIRVEFTDLESFSIDTPQDLRRALKNISYKK